MLVGGVPMSEVNEIFRELLWALCSRGMTLEGSRRSGSSATVGMEGLFAEQGWSLEMVIFRNLCDLILLRGMLLRWGLDAQCSDTIGSLVVSLLIVLGVFMGVSVDIPQVV